LQEIVLKRKSDATNDKIYATIDNVRATLVVAPNHKFQIPNSKTSNSINQIELTTQKTPLPPIQNQTNKIALGSVQTNIGHTGAASGIASIIKTALCLHHQFIPSIPNWEAPTSEVDDLYYFPTESRPSIKESTEQTKRSALVVSEGGIQVQLSEASKVSDTLKVSDTCLSLLPQLFSLRGNTEKELQQQLAALEIAVDTNNTLPSLAQQFHTKAKEKIATYCIVLIGSSKAALQQEIQFFNKTLANAFEKKTIVKTPKGSYFTPNPIGKKGFC